MNTLQLKKAQKTLTQVIPWVIHGLFQLLKKSQPCLSPVVIQCWAPGLWGDTTRDGDEDRREMDRQSQRPWAAVSLERISSPPTAAHLQWYEGFLTSLSWPRVHVGGQPLGSEVAQVLDWAHISHFPLVCGRFCSQAQDFTSVSDTFPLACWQGPRASACPDGLVGALLL